MNNYRNGTDARSSGQSMPTARREQVFGNIEPMDYENDGFLGFWSGIIAGIFAGAIIAAVYLYAG